MFSLGFNQSWQPSQLGSALVFATDPNSLFCASDDGTGHCQYLRHLYNPNQYLVQATSANRPAIAPNSGLTSRKRTLNFSSNCWFTATTSTFAALCNVLNTSSFTTVNVSIIAAVKWSSNSNTLQFAFDWRDTNSTNWYQIRQDSSDSTLCGVYQTSGGSETYSATINPITGWSYVTLLKSGSSWDFRLNGTDVGITTITETTAFSAPILAIGALPAFPGIPVEPLGGFGGIIVTNSALSSKNLTNAENWVKATYS